MLLDDHVVRSQAMAASPFSKPFEEWLVPWERKLRRFQVRAEHRTCSHFCFKSIEACQLAKCLCIIRLQLVFSTLVAHHLLV
jgi:hypothetical protein